jgi:hypothetical protein
MESSTQAKKFTTSPPDVASAAAPSGLSPIYAPEPLPSGALTHRTSVRVLPLRWLRIEAGPETLL